MRFAIISVLVGLSSTVLAGGGWVKDSGGLYMKLGQQWVNFNQYYNVNGDVVNDRTRSIGSTFLYAEYGITNRLTAIGYFPFFTKSTVFEQRNAATGTTLKEGEAINAFGDINLTAKYGLIKDKPVVLSVSILLGLNTGVVGSGSDGSLQTGDGEFNQMLRFDLSKGFKIGNRTPYLSGYIGINNRTKGLSDEFRYGIEGGINFNPLLFLLKVYGVESLNNGNSIESLEFSGLLVDNMEYLIWAPEVILQIHDQWSFSFTYAKATSGKLYYTQPSFTVGVQVDLNLKKDKK